MEGFAFEILLSIFISRLTFPLATILLFRFLFQMLLMGRDLKALIANGSNCSSSTTVYQISPEETDAKGNNITLVAFALFEDFVHNTISSLEVVFKVENLTLCCWLVFSCTS